MKSLALIPSSLLAVIVTLIALHGGRAVAEAQAAQESDPIYIGAGSCAASNCHGSVTPRNAPRIDIQQTEHTHWLKKDKHSRAYEVLLKKRSVQIAKNLSLPQPAAKSDECLVCHALVTSSTRRGPFYQIEDGVSCEVCHGPAEGWLGTHITRDYEASVQAGMYDTKNVTRRAEKCLSCHIGDEQRDVNHELIAAGHPELVFELDTFTALLPPHWRQPKEWSGVRNWAIGQSVALREVGKRLARRSQQQAATHWPEFAEFECFACHHEVRNIGSTYYDRSERGALASGSGWKASWRQARDSTTMIGLPPWDDSRYVMLRQFLQATEHASLVELEKELTTIRELMATISASDAEAIAAAATRLATLANTLTPQIANTTFDDTLIFTLLQTIAGNGNAIAQAGVRAAEQAAMTIDALYLDYGQDKSHPNHDTIQATVQKAFDALERTERYDAVQFAGLLRELQALLTQP